MVLEFLEFLFYLAGDHLGIDVGHVQGLMSQDVLNFFHVIAGIDEVGAQGVAEEMGAAFFGDVGSAFGLADAV